MPVPSTDAAILDDDDEPVALGQVGEICLRGLVVVRKDPALSEGELLAHCKQHLTAYKMPRIVEFRTEPLPKTNIGKILRRVLRDGNAAAPAASPPVASA